MLLALKLKSSPLDAPVFGHVLWTEPDRHGASYEEAILDATENYSPTLFTDYLSLYKPGESPYVVNEPKSYGEKWEYIEVELKVKKL